MPTKRVPISEAAEILGISLDTARKQVQRGSLLAEKVKNRWYVLLDDTVVQDLSQTVSASSQTTPEQVLDVLEASEADKREIVVLREFLTAKQEEVEFLRAELSARTEELRRKDHIIADLTTSLPRLPQEAIVVRTAPAQPAASPVDRFTMSEPESERPWWQRLIRRLAGVEH